MYDCIAQLNVLVLGISMFTNHSNSTSRTTNVSNLSVGPMLMPYLRNQEDYVRPKHKFIIMEIMCT